MALTNPKIFGLNVESSLTDVEDAGTSFRNLGVNTLDLSIIRGSADAGMVLDDWISFSRLKNPIYQILDRFNRESNSFEDILAKRAGIDRTLFGNLNLNGSISGSAIRYRYVDFTDGNKVKYADISTSRASAWSSSDPRANNTDINTSKLARISFGARVGITTGGTLGLNFGEQSNESGVTDQPRLQTTITPEPVEFESEEPTSTIKCKIGGQTMLLYAMKGIPIVFRGAFSSLSNANVTIKSDAIEPPVSWKIVEVDDENRQINYENKDAGKTTSTINFSSAASRDRFIKIYKNPKDITGIRIYNALISSIPTVKLDELVRLELPKNYITTIPDLTFFTPTLKNLDLRANPLRNSDIQEERSLGQAFIDKLPSDLTTIRLGGSFQGSVEPVNLFAVNLPELTILDLNRELGGTTLGATEDNPDGNCPLVTDKCVDYRIRRNSFRKIPDDDETISPHGLNFTSLPKLRILDCFGNRNLGSDPFELESAKPLGGEEATIESIEFSATDIAFPTNLSGAPKLVSFRAHDSRGLAGQFVNTATGTYIFNNCNVLENLVLYQSNLGRFTTFPISFTNASLKNLDLRSTEIKGGRPNTAPNGKSLNATTFDFTSDQITLTNHQAETANKIIYKSGNLKYNTTRGDDTTETDVLTDGLDTVYYIIKIDDNTIALATSPQKAYNGSKMDLVSGTGTHTFETLGIPLTDAQQTRVIYEETFAQAVALENINIVSSRLLAIGDENNPAIDEKAFVNNVELRTIRYQSNGRTSGRINNLFVNNRELVNIYLNNNAFLGTPPSFNTNSKIRNIYLNNNKLSGTVPGYNFLDQLRLLNLSNNQLTKLSTLGTLTSLQQYLLQNNQLEGDIVDFSGASNLRQISLTNNKLTGYVLGSFVNLTQVKNIDLSFNNLSSTALDNILIDLGKNYDNSQRSGVTINIKSQGPRGDITPTPNGAGMKAAQRLALEGWSIGITGGIQVDDV